MTASRNGVRILTDVRSPSGCENVSLFDELPQLVPESHSILHQVLLHCEFSVDVQVAWVRLRHWLPRHAWQRWIPETTFFVVIIIIVGSKLHAGR
jgi:hypothetical protein